MTSARLPLLDARSASTEPMSTQVKDISPAYWLTMFAASAFGTNLGDFWAEDLSLGRITSFTSLVVVCVVAIAMDRRWGARTEAGFWTAIVVSRAAATNCADYLTHDRGFGYPLVTAILGLAALAIGAMTLADPTRRGAPVTDLRFWAAMLLAGIFGTTGGDYASHMLGLGTAALCLVTLLIGFIVLRRVAVASAMMGYWIVLLIERTAATSAGDWFASHRGAGLGLPIAMICTGGLLAAGLGFRKAIGETLRPRP